jgi:hypothetical protein
MPFAGLFCFSAAANDANHTGFVFASPSCEPNRIVGNRDNHGQAPSGSEKDSEVRYEKEKRGYKNQEYVATHTLSEKRFGLSAPHPFDAFELGTINPTQIEFQPFLQGVGR